VTLEWLTNQILESIDSSDEGLEQIKIDLGMKQMKPNIVNWVERASTWFQSGEGRDLILKGWESSKICTAWTEGVCKEARNQPQIENSTPILYEGSELDTTDDFNDEEYEFCVTPLAETPAKRPETSTEDSRTCGLCFV